MATFLQAGTDSPAARLGELATAAWVCGRELRRRIAERLAAAQVDDEAFLALAQLDKAPEGVVQGDLAESLAVSPAQTSGLVERLRKHGWCEAQRDPHDRRRQRWVLTSAGRTTLAECRAALSAEADALLARLDAADVARTIAVLVQLSTVTGTVASSARAVA